MVKSSDSISASSAIHPHVGVRVGEVMHGAVPVLLRGDEAALVLDTPLERSVPVDLVLRWESGETTELAGQVRALDGGGRIAHLDLHGMTGAWRPFLAYLGRAADSAPAL